MKKLFKNVSILSLLIVLISCSSGKKVTKPEERDSSPKMTLKQVLIDPLGSTGSPSELVPTNNQVVVGNLDRQIIEERKIEKPKSILTRQFVSIESILGLNVGQTYGSIINSLGSPYDILHLDNKGFIVTYIYKRIHSVYDENTENNLSSKPKSKIFDATLNRAYLHFDSSKQLVLLVTDEGFNSSKSVIRFGQNINKPDVE